MFVLRMVNVILSHYYQEVHLVTYLLTGQNFLLFFQNYLCPFALLLS